MLHLRFLYNTKKRVLNEMLKRMKNFLRNKNTTLNIKKYMIIKRRIDVNIS